MNYGNGYSPDGTLTLVVELCRENLERFRRGESMLLKFRNGMPMPIDLQIDCHDTEKEATAALKAMPEFPDCIHDILKEMHPGPENSK